MTLTFLDSGVLIAFARSKDDSSSIAYDIINDSNREFVSSIFVEMEVFPKALYHNYPSEISLYRTFFDALHTRVPIDEQLIMDALARANRWGLNALDALHLEAAISAGADEFITTERDTKPMFRETEIKVISIIASSGTSVPIVI